MLDKFPRMYFSYRNHKGVVATRVVVSPWIYWGQSEFHPHDQWLMNAYDMHKDAWRTFAMKDMWNIEMRTIDGVTT